MAGLTPLGHKNERVSETRAPVDESCQWLPPQRLRRYQWHKAVTASLMVIIFAGWLTIQWSNPVARYVSIVLLVVTLWVMWRSMVMDDRQSRGRQVTIVDGMIEIATPDGRTQIRLGDISEARWFDPWEYPRERAGLWLYDDSRQPLAYLDTGFLADQAQARAFLGWARWRADVNFDVSWAG